MDVGFGFGPVQGRAHGVAIVLADEEHRQRPQRREVHGLVELALGRRALAEEAGGDMRRAAHLVGQRQAHRQRQAAADDGIAAIEAVRGVEQVHRAAAPARGAGRLAIHLGHDLVHRHAAHQRMAVLAIGGDDAGPLAPAPG